MMLGHAIVQFPWSSPADDRHEPMHANGSGECTMRTTYDPCWIALQPVSIQTQPFGQETYQSLGDAHNMPKRHDSNELLHPQNEEAYAKDGGFSDDRRAPAYAAVRSFSAIRTFSAPDVFSVPPQDKLYRLAA